MFPFHFKYCDIMYRTNNVPSPRINLIHLCSGGLSLGGMYLGGLFSTGFEYFEYFMIIFIIMELGRIY